MKFISAIFSAIFLCLFLSAVSVFAQKGVKAFGIQVRPIIPLGLVNTIGQQRRDVSNQTTLNIDESGGFNVGGVIRFGFTKRISLETGISYVERNYRLTLEAGSFPESGAKLNFPGYEVPLSGLVFVRLGRLMYMNASGGGQINFFPTGGLVRYDRDTIEYGMLELNWIRFSLLANLGFEYRTEKLGYFYIGATYCLPIDDISRVYISYRKPKTNTFVNLVDPPPLVRGAYFGIDLKYFFNPGKRTEVDE